VSKASSEASRVRILFTDFDGVLNSADSWKVSQEDYDLRSQDTEETPLSILRLTIDPSHVAILNDVLAQTGAQVVLSTSWRNWPDREFVLGKLRAAGFTGDIVGETPGYLGPGIHRGDEIQAWLDEHADEVESYAIVDDSDDMGALTPHLVLTDSFKGLTVEHVPRLFALLTPGTATKTTEWTRCAKCGGPVLVGTLCGACT
jgi:hypothetical protein